MRIVEIVPSLCTGGGERFVIDLSNTFAYMGHEVSLITLYDLTDNDILRCYVSDKVNILSLSKQAGADLKCMFRLLSKLRSIRPDVVHVHLGAITYVLLSAILFRKVKYVATIHSEAKREAGSGLSKWIRVLMFRLGVVQPVTISPESDKSFQKLYGMSGNMIINGCSEYTETFSSLNYQNYRDGVDYLFIHAGRIHDVKNQIMLVRSFKRLIDSGIKARLLIAGRVEDLGLFETLRSYFSDYIVYLGEQSSIREIMSHCDAFCLTSKMEGMPITVLEALSVGVVPIVTPVGGCVNLIRNGENGFISKNLSEESYYDSIIEFISTDKQVMNNIVNNIKRDFMMKYSIDIAAEQYLKLFRA